MEAEVLRLGSRVASTRMSLDADGVLSDRFGGVHRLVSGGE